jgi:hypothetical protein
MALRFYREAVPRGRMPHPPGIPLSLQLVALQSFARDLLLTSHPATPHNWGKSGQ